MINSIGFIEISNRCLLPGDVLQETMEKESWKGLLNSPNRQYDASDNDSRVSMGNFFRNASAVRDVFLFCSQRNAGRNEMTF